MLAVRSAGLERRSRGALRAERPCDARDGAEASDTSEHQDLEPQHLGIRARAPVDIRRERDERDAEDRPRDAGRRVEEAVLAAASYAAVGALGSEQAKAAHAALANAIERRAARRARETPLGLRRRRGGHMPARLRHRQAAITGARRAQCVDRRGSARPRVGEHGVVAEEMHESTLRSHDVAFSETATRPAASIDDIARLPLRAQIGDWCSKNTSHLDPKQVLRARFAPACPSGRGPLLGGSSGRPARPGGLALASRPRSPDAFLRAHAGRNRFRMRRQTTRA